MVDKALNMKRTILYILLGLLAIQVSAQQTSQYKYHLFEDYLLNPAYVGANDYYPVNIGRDQRFYGLSNSSPETYYITLHSRVGEGYIFEKDGKINKFFEQFGNLALGFQFFQYKFGPSRETNIGVTYGYHLDLQRNVLRKNRRKLVLAFTPRLKRIGLSHRDLKLIYDPLDGNDFGRGFYDPILGDYDNIRSWIISTDVGALYTSVHGEFGLAALDIAQTRNKLESDLLYFGEEVVDPRDILYPAKFMANARLTFLEMYNSKKFDVMFVPTIAAIYGPKTNSSEFYVDMKLQGIFKEHIAGIRSEVNMIGELGFNVNHTRIYYPSTFLQPYVTFDFKNMTITYSHTFIVDNDLTKAPNIMPGNQISLLFKISKDRVVRKLDHNQTWR
jgi:hypothetical protein